MEVARARMILGEVVGDPTVVFVTGKGGVGKSTVARVLARIGEAAGLRTALVVIDDVTVLEASEAVDSPSLISLSPDLVMVEYLETHGFGLLATRLRSSGVIDAVATAIPGIKDLLVLAKIKQLSQSGRWDLVLVDSPASGHALSLIHSPAGLAQIAHDGPISQQSQEVLDLLRDHEATGVVLVTVPEETPVTETIETIELLGSTTEMQVVSCLVNQMPRIPPEVPSSVIESLDPKSAEYLAFCYRFERRSQANLQIARLQSEWSGSLRQFPQLATPGDAPMNAAALFRDLEEDSW
ncbi:MAG: ArsA family ATPase [Ferrimicrobium sp.]